MSGVGYRILDPRRPDAQFHGRCALTVMAKVPRAGKVKTRLAPPLDSQQAAALNIAFLKDTIACLREVGKEVAADPVISYTPTGEEAGLAGIVPADIALLPQRGQGFGERLQATAEDLIAAGFSAVCLIDSDSPTVPPATYVDGAQRLLAAQDCVVLGPSQDGGYYVVGVNASHPRLFEEIAWSTDRVMEQTCERAREIGIPIVLLPAWFDVDDRQTLARLYRELLQCGEAHQGFSAANTRRYLQAISGQLEEQLLVSGAKAHQ